MTLAAHPEASIHALDEETRTLARLAAAWDLNDRVRLTGRIENLFDAEYEEVLDFGTARRSEYVGIAYRP